MAVTRRDFLKVTGVVAGGAVAGTAVFSGCGNHVNKKADASAVSTICPACDMGCGLKISVRDGKILSVQGDPRHPLNRGSVCSRGSSLVHMGDGRLDGILHRKPGTGEWETVTREEAVARIASLVKETRDRTFFTGDKNGTANTCRGIAALFGGFLSNEEYYLWGKLFRILGMTAIGGLAGGDRAAAKGLESSFGLDAMTNPWNDTANADVILVVGADPPETHPVSMAHIQRARDRGGRVITVDPRFTRTSAMSEHHVTVRPGTDTAFILGVIFNLLSTGRVNRDYMVEYTNATFLLDPSFSCAGGVFPGFNRSDKTYDPKVWKYITDEKGIPRRDRTMKDERCVYRHLLRLASDYTPEYVSLITGCSVLDISRVADLLAETADPRRTAAVVAGGGVTEHVTGVQSVRALAILQMLLGNIGQRGGGMLLLNRGANSQGMRDQGMGWASLPGGLDMPWRGMDEELDQYRHNHIPKSNDPLSANEDQRNGRYLVSLLKAWYGDAATAENDYLYRWLPRLDRPLHTGRIMEEMAAGSFEGAFLLCADPLSTAPRPEVTLKGLQKLSWLVCAGVARTDSSGFWNREDLKKINVTTEVFLLPLASPLEVTGSLTNSARLVQWRKPALRPPANVFFPLDLADTLFRSIRDRYALGGTFREPVLSACWEYGDGVTCDPLAVAREINGYDTLTGKRLDDITLVRDDGTTACGNRMYCGCFTEKGNFMASRILKKGDDPDLYPSWGWSWPSNTRILYNRASVDSRGEPWSVEKHFMSWDGDSWSGDQADGLHPPGNCYPFTHLPEGAGRVFSPVQADGPFPVYYEPPEGPAVPSLRNSRINPMIAAVPPVSARLYGCVVTLFGAGEELSPARSPLLKERTAYPLCEISPDLARRRNLSPGDTVRVISPRGSLSATLIVSPRVKPLSMGGSVVDVIMLGGPGGTALSQGSSDPSSGTAELRSFMGDIVKVEEGSRVR